MRNPFNSDKVNHNDENAIVVNNEKRVSEADLLDFKNKFKRYLLIKRIVLTILVVNIYLMARMLSDSEPYLIHLLFEMNAFFLPLGIIILASLVILGFQVYSFFLWSEAKELGIDYFKLSYFSEFYTYRFSYYKNLMLPIIICLLFEGLFWIISYFI